MDRALWQRVDVALQEAFALEPAERARFVAAILDAEVRAEVESLLAADADGLEQNLEHAISETAGRVIVTDETQPVESEISHYRLLELLGSGGMSQVYLAEDLQLGRKVALKILPRAFSIDPERVWRFEQEARAASALNHPNIVTIYEIGNVDGRWFIVMEHIEGEPLSARISRGPMPVAEALLVAEQVIAALSLTHQHGILHRDIKPANIMLRKDGLVKLVDFGIARVTQPEGGSARSPTVSGKVLGTPSYMSPEQAKGRRVNEGSDLWSLGAVLYEMVTGTMAFRGSDTPEILIAVLERRPPLPSSRIPSIPAVVDNLVMRLLARNPAARFASAAEVRQTIEQIRSSLAPAPVRRWRLTAALAIVPAALAVWYGWPRKPALEPLTTTVSENRVTAAALSTDGKILAWSERNGPLIIRRLESNARRTVELPPEWSVETISWNGDASRVLLSGYSAKDRQPDIRVMEVASGRIQLLFPGARSAVFSPDGATIAFTNGARTELWVSDANGQTKRRLVFNENADTFPVHFWFSSRRLSYQRRHFAPKPGHPADVLEAELDFEHSYGSVDAASGKVSSESPVPPMYAACALDDGRILFVTRDSGRGWASRNIWNLQTDRDTGAVRNSPLRSTTWSDLFVTGISCSRDGRSVGVTVQVGRAAVYVADLEQPMPKLANIRVLTLDEKPQYPQSWSTDSKSVYFEKGVAAGKQAVGHWDIYRQALSERTAHPLATTLRTEFYPIQSPNPDWLLFQTYDEKEGPAGRRLMRVPARGGEPEPVSTNGPFDELRCAISGTRCVLRVAGKSQHVYYELDPQRGRGEELLRTPWIPAVLGDWDLSSDGSKIAIPNHDTKTAVIHVIRLDPDNNGPKEWHVPVPGLANLRGLHWAAGDRGWFASAGIPTGVALLYVDRDGRFATLRESPIATWGVPSPDGRHLAFVDEDLQSNFWRVKGM